MLRWTLPVGLLIAALLAWAAPAWNDLPKGAPTADQAVRAFVDALNEADLPKAALYVDGAPEPKEFEDLVKALKDAKLQLRVTTVRATPSDGRATARFGLVIVRDGRASHRENRNVAVQLVQRDGRWLIVAPPLDAETDPVNGWAAALRAGPAGVRRAQEQARQAQAESQLKQLAQATLEFAAANDGKFDFTAATWKSKIEAAIDDHSIFKSPSDKSTSATSFVFNRNLANRTVASIRIRQRTVLLWEGTANALAYRYDGRGLVAFVDGSTMFVTPQDERRMLWR